jgi:hypothetical protein
MMTRADYVRLAVAAKAMRPHLNDDQFSVLVDVLVSVCKDRGTVYFDERKFRSACYG